MKCRAKLGGYRSHFQTPDVCVSTTLSVSLAPALRAALTREVDFYFWSNTVDTSATGN